MEKFIEKCRRVIPPYLRFLTRQLRLMLAVIFGYLGHVCIMPYISMNGVSPSLLIPMLAIIIVGFGGLRGVQIGLIYGIVMEVMLPSVPLMNLLFYPISSILWTLIFQDKSAGRLQVERATGKSGRNISPIVRTLLCTACFVFGYEVVNMVYMYLAGVVLSLSILGRALTDEFLTLLVTAVMLWPTRRFLGFHRMEEAPQELIRFDYRPERDRMQ